MLLLVSELCRDPPWERETRCLMRSISRASDRRWLGESGRKVEVDMEDTYEAIEAELMGRLGGRTSSAMMLYYDSTLGEMVSLVSICL